MKWMACLVLVLSTMGLLGCQINPVSGEQELRFISRDQEVEMGTRIDGEVRNQYRVLTGTAEADRVAAIGAKIATVSDRKDVQYHFFLVESGELNAFAAPGGFVYVTTETVRVAGDDAELAAVIGHEVGHVAAYHSVHQMQKALGWNILSALIFDNPESETAAQAADIAFNNVVMTGFSRNDERQADDLGVKYAAKAGYDPYGLARFFAKLEERQQAGVMDRAFEFLMSHPDTGERKRRAEAEAARYAGGER